ncbi:hypothetical protein G7Y89_g1354 [Cudoniella acicularis]|uniref:Glutamyl-tRNA amidotransferase complex subunit Gta3 domain-containing protein n=1 Tax=Cudoniella acicularis TaxID=354080 RepID=A0A8H4W7H6_9HELO|nr:hypothetical protein G7Y89_g1354 [Cudoniella acicularis]
MSAFICTNCRASLRQALRRRAFPITRSYSSNIPPQKPLNIEALLSEPTWSVRAHFAESSAKPSPQITPKQLHHLLRLSALPLPKSEDEQRQMLETLRSQLQFVRDVQEVDTEGVEPLQSIRDETEEGIKEATIGLEDMREALAKEDIQGRSRRPRRRRGEPVDTEGVEDWDVLGTASEKVETPGGRFFVVRSGKVKETPP